ncbi:MAG: hypothetical protein KUG82_19745 [Pseudomonadales bacterium]|nr:hypothetical protein [Pseudomonadales bacterium]
MKINFSYNEWGLALNEQRFSPSEIVQLAINVGKDFTWHPLGFVMCKLSQENEKNIRLHIWPNSSEHVQEPQWLIHDHMFDLKSWVLSGKIENIEYEIASDFPIYSIYQASYEQDKSILHRTEQDLSIKVKNKSVVSSGQIYEIASGILHQSISLSNSTAVTVCETIDRLDKNPIIAGDIKGRASYSYTRATVCDEDLQDIIGKI